MLKRFQHLAYSKTVVKNWPSFRGEVMYTFYHARFLFLFWTILNMVFNKHFKTEASSMYKTLMLT